MKLILGYLFLAVIASSSVRGRRLGKADINAIRAKLIPLIKNTVNEEGLRYLIPGIIRLAFHGCIGRCDGCIDKNHYFNKGLDVTVDALEPLLKEWPGSRADLWAMAYYVAKDLGRETNNQRCLEKYPPSTQKTLYDRCYTKPWKWEPIWLGRTDCDGDSPYYNKSHNYPHANMASGDLLGWFWREMRVRGWQIVALMGAHSSGRVNNFRGINRTYIDGEGDGLTFRYYSNLINLHEDRQWELKSNADGTQYYWEGQNEKYKAFALPVDMATTKDFYWNWGKYNQTTGWASKTYHRMGKAGSWMHHQVWKYAIGRSNWSHDFIGIMNFILGHGYRLERV